MTHHLHLPLARCANGLRIALAAAVLTVALMAQPAAAAGDAEQFMQGLIDRGFTILKDNSGGETARRARFHDFVLQNIETDKPALFALGQYRRGANEADLGAYSAAFRDYVTAVYESRLMERQEQSLKVTGSVENKPGDVTVNAQANDPNATDPVKIGFRLNGANGARPPAFGCRSNSATPSRPSCRRTKATSKR
jgi:ABC-type transporter MlaC component